jgi:hypothetical protein
MRAQHQTTMTVHVRKLNHGMKQQSINNQAKQQKPVPRGGISKRIQEIQIRHWNVTARVKDHEGK